MSNQTIAYQGTQGAHSHVACSRAYPYHTSNPYPQFADVFNAVEQGEVELGMIPIGNSYAGRVAEIHHLIQHTTLHIVGEYMLPIEHHLLAPKGATLDSIKIVHSHPQALMQCKDHLAKQGFEPSPQPNTAIAAEMVAQQKKTTQAALASELAAELYDLEIIERNMQDATDNRTLFLALSKEPYDPDPDSNAAILTTILFTTRNIPAGLYKALGGFATNNVNLVKLESYIPEGKSDSAQFFITFQGHPSKRSVQLAIEELGFFSNKVRVLGVYEADASRNA